MASKVYQHKEYIKNKYVLQWLYKGKCFFVNCPNNANHTHHYDKNSTNNSIFNLMPVCERCHGLLHQASGFNINLQKNHLAKLLQMVTEFLTKYP